MFTVCVGLVFRSKYVQFPIICSLQYSINISTVVVDPHSDLLHICIVKPKNIAGNIKENFLYDVLLLMKNRCYIFQRFISFTFNDCLLVSSVCF